MHTNQSLIEKQCPQIPPHQIEQLKEFAALLLDWNTRINLISRKDTEHVETHHLLSSLAIVQGIKLPAQASLLDIGTGGGLPGIPLAICFPNCTFHLVDSIGKKVRVVKDIIERLGLQNVTAQQVRAETIQRKFDFVTGRAVTALEKFIPLAYPALKRGEIKETKRGIIYLKGSEIFEELKQLQLTAEKITPLTEWYSDPYFENKFLVHIASEQLLKRRFRQQP